MTSGKISKVSTIGTIRTTSLTGYVMKRTRFLPMIIAAALSVAAAGGIAAPVEPAVSVEQTQQASIAYETNLGKLIRKNLRFATTLGATGNPDAVCLVTLAPNGDVESFKLIRSSGMYGFDKAVQNAIYRSAPFPRRDDGVMPKTFTIHFWLR